MWHALARSLVVGLFASPLAASQEAAGDRARELLVGGLEEYAQWCDSERLYGERNRAWEWILAVDPEHAEARRGLGYRKGRDGEWREPRRRKEAANRDDEALVEAPARLADALTEFREHALDLAEEPQLGPLERLQLGEELLRMDPDHAGLRGLRGEVRAAGAEGASAASSGRWVLAETIAAAARRQELVALAEKARADAPAPTALDAAPFSERFGLSFQGVAVSGLKVLSTRGAADAEGVARDLDAARFFFRRLFDAEANWPEDCTIFLFEEAERDAFLSAHPAVPADELERYRPMEGTALDGTTDWAFWSGDLARRKDGLARLAFSFFLMQAFGLGPEHGWALDGVSTYLTDAFFDTAQSWYFDPHASADPNSAMATWERLQRPDADWVVEAAALFASDSPPDLEPLFTRPSYALAIEELLRAIALAAYVVEARPEASADLFRAAAGTEAAAAFQETLELSLPELSWRLGRWLAERADAPAPARGRQELLALWEELEQPARREVVQALRAKLEGRNTLQLRLVREQLERAPAPRLVGERGDPPVFDSKLHAPSQPIRRKWLEADDDLAVSTLRAMGPPERHPDAPRLAYDYDWASGEVVRVGAADDPSLVFENALRGYPPEVDLARAVLLARLDAGEERAALAAFAHAYTDRDGRVYPGITLYDAWASGEVMEMPDVDSLGIVHTVLDEWDRWVAPVPGSEHGALYGRIGELFVAAKNYRELREALAQLAFSAELAGHDAYQPYATNFQALWAHHENDPERVADALPGSGEHDEFLAAWVERCKVEGGPYAGGERRERTLRLDAEVVRQALSEAMEEIAGGS